MIILVVTLPRAFGNTDSFPVPSQATLAGLSVPQRIVTIAESQVGYSTEPVQLLLQQVQRLLERRHGGLPER